MIFSPFQEHYAFYRVTRDRMDALGCQFVSVVSAVGLRAGRVAADGRIAAVQHRTILLPWRTGSERLLTGGRFSMSESWYPNRSHSTWRRAGLGAAEGRAGSGPRPVRHTVRRVHSVGELLDQTYTDGFLVIRHGVIVTERYFNGMRADTPHLLMSVSKSITGLVAGALAGKGELDVTAPAEAIVPELAGTSFEGATVRHLLDMRAGTRFLEDYDNPARPSRHRRPRVPVAP